MVVIVRKVSINWEKYFSPGAGDDYDYSVFGSLFRYFSHFEVRDILIATETENFIWLIVVLTIFCSQEVPLK